MTGLQALIRPFRSPDVSALARIYRESIRYLGARHYTPEQVAAWSALGEDTPGFRHWLDGAVTWVAEDQSSRCIGFSGLQPPDRIASLFVAPGHMRQGVATALARHVLSELARQGRRGATTEASEFSRPVFERVGFQVTEVEHTRVRGIAFQRYVMRLEPSPAD